MAKPKTTVLHSKVVPEQPANDKTLTNHINDKSVHINSDMIDAMTYSIASLNDHVKDQTIHITSKEREDWNSKETPNGAQSKANKVLAKLESHKTDQTIHVTKQEKIILKDKYTKAETRNLLKHALTGLKFMPSVSNKIELERKYPNPEFNTCVYCRFEKITVIYNGQAWVEFNALFTPEVTSEFDGFMTSDDKVKLDSIEEGANNYIHPDNVDIRHVSDSQIDYWNNKAENVVVSTSKDGLMSSLDKVKLDSIEEGANNYIHPEKHLPSIIEEDSTHRFVTEDQINNWGSKATVDFVTTEDAKVLSMAKAIVDSKISTLLNSSSDQLQVLRSLSFELKEDTTVKQFLDLYNECAKSSELTNHMNDKCHMTQEDRYLLNNVSSALKTGLNPEWEDVHNRPESLPANGGNADTVGGYTAQELLDNKDFYDFIIKPSTLNFEDLGKGNVLIKKGSYFIVEDDELTIKTSGSTISGVGILTEMLGISIRIIGNNNTIQNIKFDSPNDKIVNKTCIYVEGDYNTIKSNTICNYDRAIVIEGSNNIIESNTVKSCKTGIRLTTGINSNAENKVVTNTVKNCDLGIVLTSTNNILSKNYVCKNNVDECNTGILLTNSINNSTRTTSNIISENIVSRANGFSLNQHPIVSDFSSKNMISSNITLGKQINALNDILLNNIY